jgi:hypothetical protein
MSDEELAAFLFGKTLVIPSVTDDDTSPPTVPEDRDGEGEWQK